MIDIAVSYNSVYGVTYSGAKFTFSGATSSWASASIFAPLFLVQSVKYFRLYHLVFIFHIRLILTKGLQLEHTRESNIWHGRSHPESKM